MEAREDLSENGAARNGNRQEEANEDKPNYEYGPSMSERSTVENLCCPKRLVVAETLPLYLCLAALILTHTASWTCAFFEGADISITGGHYGLWTVQDSLGKCQLWDVLFFSYQWDPALEGARFLSMAAMLVGLAMFTTMVQAQQAHYLCFTFGLLLAVLFVVSVLTTDIFNIWLVFWLTTYIIFILIVRSLFVHPVHRLISKRGSHIIGYLLVFCFVSSMLTLTVLRSDYCTCDIISTRDLEDRVRNSTCVDNGHCLLDWGGYAMVAASLLWLASAVATFKFGVQPSYVQEDPGKVHIEYTGYSRDSITTKVQKLFRGSYEVEEKNNAPDNGVNSVVEQNDKLDLDNKSNESDGPRVINADDSSDDDDSIDPHLIVNVDDSSDDNDGKYLGNLSIETENMKEDERNLPSSHDEDGNVDERRRTMCQRLCCDFRVTERSTKEKWRFWSFRVALGLMVTIYFFLITLLIGSRVENRKAEQAPSTVPYFVTDVVCAFDPNDTAAPFQTFSTPALANASGYTVAHCGACAYCSNYQDIETYIRTRKTIAKTAKSCGRHALIGTYDGLVGCLEKKIGFTSQCTECWADNMVNTANDCFFTCAKTLFTGFMSENNVPGSGDGWLNQCIYCDEKRSGPAFVTCSGVARRRLRVVSEIERNEDEQCQYVGVDWVKEFDDVKESRGL